MRKKVYSFLLTLSFAISLFILSDPVSTNANQSFVEPQKIRCTCYCDQGYTKSGQWVREGIIAGKEEWLGKVALLYQVDEDGTIGDFIGYYEFLDTGYGINGSLIEGTSIDVYRPTLDECYEWVRTYGDYVYLQIVDGKG